MAGSARSGRDSTVIECRIQECRTIPPASTARAGRSVARNAICSGGRDVSRINGLSKQSRPVMAAVAAFGVRHRCSGTERGISRGRIDMVEHHAGKIHAGRTKVRSHGMTTAGITIRRCHDMAGHLACRRRSIVTRHTCRRGCRPIRRERSGVDPRYMRKAGPEECRVSRSIRCSVARDAIRRRHHMPCNLGLRSFGHVAPVMASRTRDSRGISQRSLVEFRVQESCVVQG